MRVIKILGLLLMAGRVCAQGAVHVTVNEGSAYQTIENFGASDAWGCQFAGEWPLEKKQQMADLLFSTKKGIGLSIWRMNLGAGSMEQGDSSGINDKWRRAAAGLMPGQLWFMQAAKERGVRQFLGFFNSPPVWMTRNGKAYATKGRCNIDPARYDEFARYAVKMARSYRLDYLSPVNEPEWGWSDGGQEGCPYTDAEIRDMVRVMERVADSAGLRTQVVAPEAGHLNSLFRDTMHTRSGVMAGHSYFTTSPWKEGVALRQRLAKHVESLGQRFWQTEYCILGNNAGEIDGGRRDTGMEAALYLARVVHMDLVYGRATAWQWWLAVSPYDYKDGLIYVDKEEKDGRFFASKKMWALGNYSRWIRPGMRRVEVEVRDGVSGRKEGADSLLVSAFTGPKSLVVVVVNSSAEACDMFIDRYIGKYTGRKEIYVTNEMENLGRHEVGRDGSVKVDARSVCTVVIKKK